MLTFSRSIFEKFNICLPQNDETKHYLKKLGAKKIKKLGNLKFSETTLKTLDKINKSTKNFLNKKKILFGAISTHSSEETFCAKIHSKLKKKHPNGITIIIPRHTQRSSQIVDGLEKIGLKVHLHSSKITIKNNIDVYLVDTYGETKTFLNMCKIVYLGGSIIKRGGQNPLEAARSGCKVMHGSNVDNFKEIYELLNKIGVSSKIKNVRDAKLIINKNLQTKIRLKKNINKINLLVKKILKNIDLEIKNLI